MDLVLKFPAPPRRLGILAGGFHPITRAHIALAEAALSQVGEVLFVMPREFPHKRYEVVALGDRIEMVRQSVQGEPRFGVAVSDGGLFLEIAREARRHYPGAELWFLCGADAAARIVEWRYEGESIEEQLDEYGLLVADRQARYEPPPHLVQRIRQLPLDADWNDLSATEVRRRIKAGEPWRHLVPQQIVEMAARLYER